MSWEFPGTIILLHRKKGKYEVAKDYINMQAKWNRNKNIKIALFDPLI